MIAPMKKAVIIAQSKDIFASIEKLRSLGILHIEHQNPPSPRDMDTINAELSRLGQAIGILSNMETKELPPAKSLGESGGWSFALKRIIALSKRLSRLEEYSRALKEKIQKWLPWGDFDPRQIAGLAQKNIYLRLYQVSKKELRSFPENVLVKEISSGQGRINCLAVSPGPVEIAFKEIALPEMSLTEMRRRLAQNAQTLTRLKEELVKSRAYYRDFRRINKSLENEREFQKVFKGRGEQGAFSYIKGYLPEDAVGLLLEAAQKEKWAVSINDPDEEDAVPTLIRNPRWVSLVSPVFKLLEIIPGYRELDISFCFLVFFSVFFGILIGDAGYGLVYILLTLFLQRKFAAKFNQNPNANSGLKDNSRFILLYILSGCAVVWGALSASFFGQEWLAGIVKPLVPALKSDKNMQAFCFFLGALHLSIAHFWRALIKLPSILALADIGWILILWGSFFLAKFLILGEAFPAFAKGLFAVGAALVILFSAAGKNIFKGLGEGLRTFFLSAVSAFTDVVSYVRLFAVGLAGAAVADAFNRMALDLGFGSLLAGFLASLALFCGHGLNIILGPLSILVHGARLNVLEFSAHAEVKWSGFAYNPFKKVDS